MSFGVRALLFGVFDSGLDEFRICRLVGSSEQQRRVGGGILRLYEKMNLEGHT